MRAPDDAHDPELAAIYARANGTDFETQLRAEIDRARAEALERAPAARLVIDRMARSLRGRVTRFAKAHRRLCAVGAKRKEGGSHGQR